MFDLADIDVSSGLRPDSHPPLHSLPNNIDIGIDNTFGINSKTRMGGGVGDHSAIRPLDPSTSMSASTRSRAGIDVADLLQPSIPGHHDATQYQSQAHAERPFSSILANGEGQTDDPIGLGMFSYEEAENLFAVCVRWPMTILLSTSRCLVADIATKTLS
jgi:hypothetical protein